LTAPARVTVQSFAVDSVLERGRSETSRTMKDVTGAWRPAASRELAAGTFIVRAAQPFGLVAFYLLEPQSEDGLMQWSFYDGIVAPHTAFPVVRVTAPATLRSRMIPN
jgi:hypothetical protein